ncbi:factor Xa inhibitor BuXI-like [Arachis stenosperma]|uniref:factor Xa inhibitor BuXI-like n=1 Tax=Arachis stenosperma TaxID=217475 RepID=UPI0025ABA79C|nr:factor Xa inhibitor BuXI-like [Arachis stenosperma]
MARISSFLALFFLLFAFTIKFKCVIAGTVFDTDNSPVKNGGDYYVLPVSEGEGGGVTIASIGLKLPLAVVQNPSQNILGLPVSISNSDGTMVIQTDGFVSIKFTNLGDSSTWIVVLDDSANMWYVAIGNAQDYLSDRIRTGSFKINYYNDGYKFVFCSDSSTSDCEDVGIYTDGYGNNRLALNGAAFAIQFQSVEKGLAAY